MVFWVIDFLKKMNENNITWGIIVVKLNSFVCFLEEIDDPKNHFEINWPLTKWLNDIELSRDKNALSENISPPLYYKTFTQSTLDMTKSLFNLILSYLSLSIEVNKSLLNKNIFFLWKNCNITLQFINNFFGWKITWDRSS